MDEIISQFMDITGVDRGRAEFYISLSANQLEVALANFFETVIEQNAAEEEHLIEESTRESSRDQQQPQQQQQEVSSRPVEVSEANSMDLSKSKPPAKPKTNPKLGTIASLQNKDSSSDEEGQAFYAGGSKHSGQQVLGPNKKKNDVASDVFKSCQEQSISLDKSHSHQQRPSTFSGTGYKLGQTNSDTEIIPGASSAQSSSNSSVITLKLWRDGFTINDRELRSYSDPRNREFTEAIKRSEIPAELRQEFQGEVRLDMEDHHHEEYVPPNIKVKAFTGRGHKLGSPSPATVGMTVPYDTADQVANESQARCQLNIDTNNPVTTIQIRLADGQNIRGQFNLTHTIGDIRRFIVTTRPQYASQEFILLTSYPVRELSEDDKTIDEMGLKNSTIMQRLKSLKGATREMDNKKHENEHVERHGCQNTTQTLSNPQISFI